jgi:hypothetical protein
MSTNIDYSVEKNILKVKSEEVQFDWPIAEIVAFNDILVVRVEPDPGVCFNENVFGVSANGEIVWAVEKLKHVYGDSPYTKIIAKDEHVKLFNWDGDELLVDPFTGKITAMGYGR